MDPDAQQRQDERKAQRPILHVVYAGRGDSLYVEFDQQDADKTPLFVMDGGPRSYGSYTVGKVDNGSKPYWRFFFSAGKEIWYDKSHLERPPNIPFKLHALLNSHAHEDHIDGMIDMIRKLSPSFLGLETGFITPAFDVRNTTTKKNEKYIPVVWKGLCYLDLNKNVEEPRLCFPLKANSETDFDVAWNRNEFAGGLIEYPPAVDTEDGKPTVICLRRPTDIERQTPDRCPKKPQGREPYFTKEWLVSQVSMMKAYAEKLQEDENFKTGKGLNDLNLSSLLVHVPSE